MNSTIVKFAPWVSVLKEENPPHFHDTKFSTTEDSALVISKVMFIDF